MKYAHINLEIRENKRRIMILKLILDFLFLMIIGYYTYMFIQLLFKMRKNIIFPTSNEEFSAIRKYPQKPVNLPTYSKQKMEIIIYSFVLLLTITMFIIGAFYTQFDGSFYLLLLLPLSNAHNLLNLFAIAEDGLLTGSRYVAWRKIKSFYFVPIDRNHKYYGFSKEVNKGYELIIKKRIFSISCIVTSEEVKEKLTEIFDEHGLKEQEESLYKVSRY